METVSAPVNTQMFERVSHAAGRHYLVDVWRRFRRNYLALAGLIVLIVLVGAAIAAPLITTGEPNKADLRPEMSLVGPNFDHFFGTDDAGRDWFTRSMYGARVSLMVAFFAMAISIAIGTTVGCVAGFFGGWVDTLLMRLVEVLLSLPLFFLILIAQALLGPSIWNLTWVIGVTTWMNVSRIVRAETLSIMTTDFLDAANAIGVPPARRMIHYVLPNIIGSIIVAATLSIAYAILTEASLSYLGMGVPLPDASWGNMLQKGLTRLQTAPWLVLFPGLLISLTVLAFNFVGNGLRDAFDPLTKHR
jgi:peptide/nickel transport system permease protein